MDKPRRKKIGSVILSAVAFAFLVDDSVARLQRVATLIPVKYSAYLPVVYGTLFLIALLLLRSAHNDEAEATAKPLDVRLEGTYPGLFVVHADGHACEIRVGPIVLESSVYGTFKYGDEVMREASPRYLIEFPVVSGLRDGDREVAPELFFENPTDPHHSRSRWSAVPNAQPPMAEFFRMAMFLRSREHARPDRGLIGDAEVDAVAQRSREPHHFNVVITFWNPERTQQWARHEVLVYEPRTGTAFVRHSGTPVPLPSASSAAKA